MNAKTLTKTLGLAVLVAGLAAAWGCESVSLLGRDSVAEPRYGDRRDADRRGDYDRRDSRREQVYGTIQDIDERRNVIRVRADGGRTATIRYDSNTRVFDGRRDVRVEALRPGDQVSIELERSSGGEQYANAIRVEDRRGSWWR